MARPRPPCPGDVSGPPGHNKTADPNPRPCNSGHGNSDHGIGGGNGIVLAPFALGGALLSWTRRLARRGRVLRRRRRR